jgi:hypothetical protein
MDLLDAIALWGRRYDQQANPRTGERRFTLQDLLLYFDRSALLELTPLTGGAPAAPIRPDPVRKVKVSLLDDGISAIQSGGAEWYEVFRTAPSGDLSKVRIIAHKADGAKAGEIRMLVGRRTYDQYFAEDPIFRHIEERSGAG